MLWCLFCPVFAAGWGLSGAAALSRSGKVFVRPAACGGIAFRACGRSGAGACFFYRQFFSGALAVFIWRDGSGVLCFKRQSEERIRGRSEKARKDCIFSVCSNSLYRFFCFPRSGRGGV